MAKSQDMSKKQKSLRLSSKENEIMDLLVSHFVDFYFSDPKAFIEPVLDKKLYNTNRIDVRNLEKYNEKRK